MPLMLNYNFMFAIWYIDNLYYGIIHVLKL